MAKRKSGSSIPWMVVILAVALLAFGSIYLMSVLDQAVPAQSAAAASQPKEALPLEVDVKTAAEYRAEGAFILDVREVDEWNAGHIPGATLIPLADLPARLSEVPKDQDVVVVCRSGNRSARGRDILLRAGYERVTSMGGGMNAWAAAGYDVITGP